MVEGDGEVEDGEREKGRGEMMEDPSCQNKEGVGHFAL